MIGWACGQKEEIKECRILGLTYCNGEIFWSCPLRLGKKSEESKTQLRFVGCEKYFYMLKSKVKHELS
jgi:hypothetical protein